ncbi:unnamed protein product [Echinostoma caproni]|uniref:G_PROTEIN_RECEP_F1_2 domain-containing protein n=1 Tax=Echinostoma caproni TaxID=27848 RepID=A0A183A611_9TREM|nr:unnamed protein product [Echinostoma caproni]
MTEPSALDNVTNNLFNRCRLFIEQAQAGILTDPDAISLCLPSQYKIWEAILIGLVLTMLTVATAGGNLLIGLAILLVRRLRNPANLLLLNLALSDFMISLLVLPFAVIYQLTGYWPFDQNVCDVYIVCDVLLCTASILSLCAISVDRYLAITRPLTYASKRTTSRMIFMIGTCWLLAGLISVPPVFIFEKPKLLFHCGYSEDLTYQIYATFSAFYIPLFIMLVLYGRIYFIVRKLAVTNSRASSQLCEKLNLSDIPVERSNGLGGRGERLPSAEMGGEHLALKTPSQSPLCGRTSARLESICGEGGACGTRSQIHENPRTISNDLGPAMRSNSNRLIPPFGLTSLQMQSSTFSRLLSKGSRRESLSSEPIPRKRGFANSSENAKAVITLGVIMGSFTLCWLPFFLCQLLTPILNAFHLSLNQIVSLQVFQFFLWLGYMNSLLNPIIYAKFNRDFRLPFCYILKCQCKGINQRVRRSSYVTQFEGQRYSHSIANDKQRPSASRYPRRPQYRLSTNSELAVNRGSNARIQNLSHL